MDHMAMMMDRQIEGALLAHDEALAQGARPAFPVSGDQPDESFNGISIRDYFAAKAMQALIASAGLDCSRRVEVASHAYGFADDMLAARSK